MARYRGSVCRFCRREGLKLYLKGDRCYSDKCAVDRRNYPPGQHGQGRIKYSDYGVQLREKQKVKRIYGMLERQFRLTFEEAERMKGVTGTSLLQLLERRLDNVVYRLGFARSRNEARILVRHAHFRVNGRPVNVPSFSLSPGDVIALKDRSRKSPVFQAALETRSRRGDVPRWLELSADRWEGVFKELPAREDITMPIEEQMIVELYSK
ncbi:MAG: 30S ribosomal protein S4 [Deltaproteobacteria bacterium RBG_13_61_14]|nr:MAG: 30S ribosomal protein S4 [Deltaproteobacteria bacterium RBG_13_61_14]